MPRNKCVVFKINFHLIYERYKIFLCWLIKKTILTSHEALKEMMFLSVRNGKKYFNAIYISNPLWDFSSVAIQNTYWIVIKYPTGSTDREAFPFTFPRLTKQKTLKTLNMLYGGPLRRAVSAFWLFVFYMCNWLFTTGLQQLSTLPLCILLFFININIRK